MKRVGIVLLIASLFLLAVCANAQNVNTAIKILT